MVVVAGAAKSVLALPLVINGNVTSAKSGTVSVVFASVN